MGVRRCWGVSPHSFPYFMKFSALIAQIKTEARIKAGTEFDAMVIGLLNEMYKEAVENQRPFELRAEVEIPIPNTGQVPLPNDFFIHHQVIFEDADGRSYSLSDQDKPSQPAPRGMYGHPKSFEITGAIILLKPATTLAVDDVLRLIYFRLPPIVTLQNVNDENSIVRLEPFLIRTCIRRIRMFHSDDVQVAQMLTSDVSAAASGFTRDEPERNENNATGR